MLFGSNYLLRLEDAVVLFGFPRTGLEFPQHTA
jgi:hypothetical protein